MQFSVIIPSFNRSRILEKTLSALADQDHFDGSYEVIVVDDGSTDVTAETVRAIQANYPVPLHYHYQLNRKQGAARNLGVRTASGDTLVFLGDDTVPTTSFLREHQHARVYWASDTASRERLAVIGYTTWPDEIRQTRFLRYIGEQGWQFGFSLITDPGEVPFNYFYTSNLSINRDFFQRSGGFDEDFQEYGWEDTELSLRLKKAGMRLVFHREALVHHFHEINLASFVDRQHRVGFSAWGFYKKHPEMGEFLNVTRIPIYGLFDRFRFRILTFACQLFERSRWPDLSRYYPDLMSYHYLSGLTEAMSGKMEVAGAQR